MNPLKIIFATAAISARNKFLNIHRLLMKKLLKANHVTTCYGWKSRRRVRKIYTNENSSRVRGISSDAPLTPSCHTASLLLYLVAPWHATSTFNIPRCGVAAAHTYPHTERHRKPFAVAGSTVDFRSISQSSTTQPLNNSSVITGPIIRSISRTSLRPLSSSPPRILSLSHYLSPLCQRGNLHHQSLSWGHLVSPQYTRYVPFSSPHLPHYPPLKAWASAGRRSICHSLFSYSFHLLLDSYFSWAVLRLFAAAEEN